MWLVTTRPKGKRNRVWEREREVVVPGPTFMTTVAPQRLRSDAALPGTGGGVETVDWLEIRHDESDAVVDATRNALHYLRTLKQGIPTPEVVVTSAADDASEAVEDAEGIDGSQGITKRELLERQVRLHATSPPPTAPLAARSRFCAQYYARQERENVLDDSDEEDEDGEEGGLLDGGPQLPRGRGSGRGRARTIATTTALWRPRSPRRAQ